MGAHKAPAISPLISAPSPETIANMKKTSVLLIILSVVIFVIAIWPLRSMWKAPEERARDIVAQDIEKIVASGQVGELWGSLKDIQLQFSDSSLFHYLNREHIPVSLKEEGKYELHIQVIRWIEGHKHGLVMDFEFFDVASQNKVSEFGRTYHLGYIW